MSMVRSKASNWRRLTVVALAGGLVGVAAPPAAAQGRGPGKWVATKKIRVDERSGQLRVPTAAETAELVASLEQMIDRSGEGVATTSGPGGASMAAVDTGFLGVVLSRPTEDGGVETRCVLTMEEAADFLGLVAEDAVTGPASTGENR